MKSRIPKASRIAENDSKIRKSRTKLEAKLLSDVKKAGVTAPVLYDVDLENKSILMEAIEGKMLKEVIDDSLAYKIGVEIAKIHSLDIIHGDITTSNIMLRDGKLVFLDFGLGRHSDLFEDKAVDLLVLKKSLQSIDSTTASKYFDDVLDGYADSYGENKDKIIKKIKEIESRGRYTH